MSKAEEWLQAEAERVARVALQGFFDDPDGFVDMKRSPNTRMATKAILQLLSGEELTIRSAFKKSA